MRGKRKQTTV